MTTTQPLTIADSIWQDDSKLRRVFSWLTRIGAAPKFGTLCIQYYQQDQCNAIDALHNAAALRAINLKDNDYPVRLHNGFFQVRLDNGKWQVFAMLTCGQIVAR